MKEPRLLDTRPKTIPIVIANTGDAVRSGFVASLAHPGGNITGLTSLRADLNGKRLELLREVIPKLSRVAFIWSPTSPIAADNLKETETVARSLRIGIQSIEVKGPDDIEAAFQATTKKRAEAIMLDGEWILSFHAKTNLRARGKDPASSDIWQRCDMSKQVDKSLMRTTVTSSTGAPLSTWIRFSRVQNLLTYPWNGPRSLSW